MTLDPQAQLILDLAERSTRPLLESLDPPAARVQYAEMVASVSGDPPAGVVTEDSTIPGPGGELPTRLYRPQDVEGPLPILIFFHGGGYVIGDRDTHDIPCRRLCLGAACLVVSVDYRLAPEHPFPAPVDDAWAATRWVVDHATELGGDPARVAVGGDSAGGNLAAVVCHMAKREGAPKLAYQLLIYPGTDLTGSLPSHKALGQGYRLTTELLDWFMMHYFSQGGDRGQLIASPLFADDFADLPPAFILTAGYDPLKDEGSAYADKLRAAGVQTEFVEYGGMIHGFICMGGLVDAAVESMDVCAAALGRAFGSHEGGWLIDAPDRRYSDEEFALILQRASKLQDRADGAGRSRGAADGAPASSGLSLQAVREIAEEVGLETRFIDQAAASLLHDPPGKGPGLFGGAVTHRIQDTFARTLTQAQRVELLDVVREVLRHQGEIRDVMGAAEWSSVGLPSRTTVTVHSHDDSVSIRVFTDLSGVAVAIWVTTLVVSMFVGAVVLNSLPWLAVTVAVGLGVARTIWSATTKFFRRRTERLREEIASYLSN